MVEGPHVCLFACLFVLQGLFYIYLAQIKNRHIQSHKLGTGLPILH